jgi:hypothetical protein
MTRENTTPKRTEIEERLKAIGRYSRFVQVGSGVILLAFLLAIGIVFERNLSGTARMMEVLLMPLTFVGLGLILFGVGMHLHLLHLNLVRQLQPESRGDRP